MARSLFEQLQQVRGTRTFFTDMKRALAESAGRHYSSGNITTVSGSTTATDSSTSFGVGEVNNFIVIEF